MKNELRIEIILACKIHTVEKAALRGSLKGGVKRRTRRGRVSLTQYLEFQEEQDMTRLFNFTRTQKMRREDVSVLEWRRGKVYIVVVEKI